jgi:hypothetical protein
VEEYRKYLEGFEEGLQNTHDMWIFRVLEYVSRYSRVDTGRSRAGWFKIMDTKGYDYSRSLVSLPGKEDETEQGRAQGDFVESPLNTTIINNVKYVEPMNRRFGIFGFEQMSIGRMNLGSQGIRFEDKIPQFEMYGEQNLGKFMDNCKLAFEKMKPFKAVKVQPITNDPPAGA